MRYGVIGTAGHIDHGKTALIKALTGRDTDRLKEEKQRGITIDLGFTYYETADGERIGVIDVPGHEKLVANMAAGIPGMDLVLFVVAANEGVMPQTKEHLELLHLLGVTRGILVLNKCDLADGELRELAAEELRALTAGTFLEAAPLVRTSAVTGDGIEELKRCIEEQIREASKEEVKEEVKEETKGDALGRHREPIPRLPVDRVFTLQGTGVVVTGTLLEGRITKGDLLECFPSGGACKVRGIQVYHEEKEYCLAGQRAALNLAGISRGDVGRGSLLVKPEILKPSKYLNVCLEILKDSGRSVRNQERLHLYCQTSELLCRAVLLEQDCLNPGESGYAQLRLETEAAFLPGDRFAVRFYSPVETIGGGVILESVSGKVRRRQETVIQRLRARQYGTPAQILEAVLREVQFPVSISALRTEFGIQQEAAEIQEIVEMHEAGIWSCCVKGEQYLWHPERESRMKSRLAELAAQDRKLHPYRRSIKKEELYQKLFSGAARGVFDSWLEWLESEGFLLLEGGSVRTAQEDEAARIRYERAAEEVRAGLDHAGYRLLRREEIRIPSVSRAEDQADLLACMEEQGEICCLDGTFYISGKLLWNAEELIRERLQESGRITITEIKELLATTRKSVRALLEYTDQTGLTLKCGAESERVAGGKV